MVWPVQELGPVLEDFAQEHPDIRVVKVNVDENPDLAGRYDVKNIPLPAGDSRRTGDLAAERRGWFTKEKTEGNDWCVVELPAAIALSEISFRHQAPSQRICFTPR